MINRFFLKVIHKLSRRGYDRNVVGFTTTYAFGAITPLHNLLYVNLL